MNIPMHRRRALSLLGASGLSLSPALAWAQAPASITAPTWCSS